MEINSFAFLGVDHLDPQMIDDVNLIIEKSPVPVRGPGGVGAPIVTRRRVVINGDAATGDNSHWDFEPVLDDEVDPDLENKPYKIVALCILLRFNTHFGRDDHEDYSPDQGLIFMPDEDGGLGKLTPETYPELFTFYESLFGPYTLTERNFDFDEYHSGYDIDKHIPEAADLFDATHLRKLLLTSEEEEPDIWQLIQQARNQTKVPTAELINILVETLLEIKANPREDDGRPENIHNFMHGNVSLESGLLLDPRVHPLVDTADSMLLNLYNFPTCALTPQAAHRHYKAVRNAINQRPEEFNDRPKDYLNAAHQESPSTISHDLETFPAHLRGQILDELQNAYINASINGSTTLPGLRVDLTTFEVVLQQNAVDTEELLDTAKKKFAEMEAYFRQHRGNWD